MEARVPVLRWRPLRWIQAGRSGGWPWAPPGGRHRCSKGWSGASIFAPPPRPAAD